MKPLFALFATVLLAACANTNCRAMKEQQNAGGAAPVSKEADPMTKTSVADRVRVSKPDGSLQCGQGKATAISEMQKQLKDIHVYSAENKNDGLMRIQLCGSPTGNHNVYEINRKDLSKALSYGFIEWTFD